MTAPLQPAALAFDRLAPTYDAIFTNSSIGHAQRMAVWTCADRVFKDCGHLLELNCGTGEDALHFATQGFQVTACDISPAMIREARRKASTEDLHNHVRFLLRATEEIGCLAEDQMFNGVFSNFSGLNCVADLSQTANSLATLVPTGAPLLLCFSTRYCLWEIVWYLFHHDLSRAFRRCQGHYETKLRDVVLPVHYPTCRQIRKSFADNFRLVSIYGIGITVPPSYVESWISRRPRLLSILRRIDSVLHTIPGIRALGDHIILHFERAAA